MEKSNFDNKIKAALEDIEVKMPADAWQKMEQKYHASITEEQPEAVAEIDKIVVRRLQNMEVSYRRDSWGRMEHLLVANKLLIRKIWVTKISELMIASLLLLGWYDATFSPQAQFPKHRQVKPTTNEPVADNEAHGKKGKSAADMQLQAATRHETAANAQNGEAATTLSNHETNIFSGIAVSIANIFDWKNDSDAANNDTPAATLENGTLQNAQAGAQINASATTDADALSSAKWLVTPLDFVDLTQHVTADKIALASLNLPTQPLKAPTQWYLGIYGSVGNTQVNTPGLQAIATTSYATYSPAYAGGMVAGARKGNWFLETGLGYSNTNFAPQTQTEIYSGNINEGYTANQLINTQYQQLHIPVAVGRRILKHNRTEVSLKAGATANLVAGANHQYQTKYFQGGAKDEGNNTNQGIPRSPQYQQQGNGLFQGGGTNNMYMTADIGIRGEYKLGDNRTKLFAEANHSANLLGTGVGSFSDNLSTTSLRAGILTTL